MTPNGSSLRRLLEEQCSWATALGLDLNPVGYVVTRDDNLFQPLSPQTEAAFRAGGGSELGGTNRKGPIKFHALHSSAALAANVFDFWDQRSLSNLVGALGLHGDALTLRFERQFPTGLRGTPPNLDLALDFSDGSVVGVESKFTEWLTPKPIHRVSFREAYFPLDRSLWSGVGLPRFQALAESIHGGANTFRYLDAPQLLKHALGLATRVPGKSKLLYLFYDVGGRESRAHLEEIARFEEAVGTEMAFQWMTYQRLFERLEAGAAVDLADYLQYLRTRYFRRITDERTKTV